MRKRASRNLLLLMFGLTTAGGVAHAQPYDEPSDLVDPGLMEWRPLLSADDLAAERVKDNGWPEAGAAGSGWDWFLRIVGPAQRYVERTSNIRDRFGNWIHEYGVGPSASREALGELRDVADDEGLYELIDELDEVRGFTPPRGEWPPGHWLIPAMVDVSAAVGDLTIDRLLVALRDGDVWHAAVHLNRLYALQRLAYETNANEPGTADGRGVMMAEWDTPLSLVESMITLRISFALKHELQRVRSIDDNEAGVLLLAMSRGRADVAHAREVHHAVYERRLIERLLDHRVEFGIDVEGSPGEATGDDPVEGARRWFDQAESVAKSFPYRSRVSITTIPTLDDIRQAAELAFGVGQMNPGQLRELADWEDRAVEHNDWPGWQGPWLERSLLNLQSFGRLRLVGSGALVSADLAIRAHRGRHGRVPLSWSDLDRDLRRMVPMDWFTDDGGIRYQLVLPGARRSGSYLLYSVGIDRVDHGGMPQTDDRTRFYTGFVEAEKPGETDNVFTFPPPSHVRERADEVLYWPPYVAPIEAESDG